MSAADDDDQGGGGESSGSGSAAIDRDHLRDIVREVLAEQQPAGGRGRRAAPDDDGIAAQVEAAVAKVRAKDAEQQRSAATEKRIAALEAREKRPAPRRRIEQIMGWITDGD